MVKVNSRHMLSIVMPIYNGATTLNQVFEGLQRQSHKELVSEIIVINDASTDKSADMIEEFKKRSSYKVVVISNQKSKGLANGYNEGVRLAMTDFVITMHQDIVIQDLDAFRKVLNSFDRTDIVAAYPIVLHPFEVWKNYNFWQKCLFSRFVGRRMPVLTGKFDCFRVDYLKEVGMFDSNVYRTAGEDSDLKIKIMNDNKRAVNLDVAVEHLQYIENNFSLKKLIKKEAQLAEAQGVILRRHGPQGMKDFLLNFFRQILLLGLLPPYARIVSLGLIIAYSFAYTRLVYRYELKNPRIVLLPFINIYLLFVAFAVSARGFVVGKQQI